MQLLQTLLRQIFFPLQCTQQALRRFHPMPRMIQQSLQRECSSHFS
jgi:hypothetical protein